MKVYVIFTRWVPGLLLWSICAVTAFMLFVNYSRASIRVADVASIMGLSVSILGFIITIRLSAEAQFAASLAKDEVEKFRVALVKYDTVRNASEAVAIFEEIGRRFLFDNGWVGLHERYGSLRRVLGNLKADSQVLSTEERTSLVAAQAELKSIEDRLKRATITKTIPNNLSAMEKLTSSHLDAVADLLSELRNRMD